MKNSGYCYLLACFLFAPMTNAFAETLQHAWKAALAADHGLKAVQENTAAAAQQLPLIAMESGSEGD